jgi:hypothetical protein
VLAVHVERLEQRNGVRNIERVCNGLGYELHTIVMDWPTMKELQRAYLFSGLANLDVRRTTCSVRRCTALRGNMASNTCSTAATSPGGGFRALSAQTQLPRFLGDEKRPQTRAR